MVADLYAGSNCAGRHFRAACKSSTRWGLTWSVLRVASAAGCGAERDFRAVFRVAIIRLHGGGILLFACVSRHFSCSRGEGWFRSNSSRPDKRPQGAVLWVVAFGAVVHGSRFKRGRFLGACGARQGGGGSPGRIVPAGHGGDERGLRRIGISVRGKLSRPVSGHRKLLGAWRGLAV